MNPLTNVKNINKLNETELSKGLVNKKSWHDLYKGSAWIFIGGLSYGLTEGDILCVFSQYGEIVNINLIRDKKTGKIKGFCFLCYANQKSTILAVDNLNGIKICGRTIRVDHVANYKPPKDNEQDDEITKMLKSEGCAPQPIKAESSIPTDETMQKKKYKKHKKEKKKHKKRKREDPAEEFSLKKVKTEKVDDGYSKYEFPEKSKVSRRNESSEDESSDSSSESDSTCVSRKKKHESHSKYDKNHKNSNGKRSTVDKSRANKHDPRKEHASSSDSDDNLGGKRKSLHANDHRNGLSSEEYSGRHKKADRSSSNKDYNARSTSSRHFQHDSSSGSEKDSYPKQNNRTMDKEKEYRRDSRERMKNSYKDRKQENPHSSYQDHRNRRSPHKTDHYQNERRDYSEKYEHFDKSRDSKREHGKHHFEQKER